MPAGRERVGTRGVACADGSTLVSKIRRAGGRAILSGEYHTTKDCRINPQTETMVMLALGDRKATWRCRRDATVRCGEVMVRRRGPISSV